MTEPLKGVRVLDLTNVLAGPFCCYQLALMGAEVVKVERPGSGDLARVLGADPELNEAGMGVSFLAQNAGKKSVTLDMKSARGKDLLKRLVRRFDVLVENFRPGVMNRLGLGYDALKVENPELIYCAISGFGQDGPRKDDPAYDQIVQGISGVMSITGGPDTTPYRVGYPLADTVGGMTAAFSVAAALNANPRGAFLDISMTDAVIASMGWVVSNYLIGGVEPAAHGNENTTSAPSGTFATADQPINIAANRDVQWKTLASHLGRKDLLDNPDYRTREDRKANRDALRAELEKVLCTRPASDWVGDLNRLGVPAGPVLTVPQVLNDPQIAERGLISNLAMGATPVQVTASPVIFDGQRPSPAATPANAWTGQHCSLVRTWVLGSGNPHIARRGRHMSDVSDWWRTSIIDMEPGRIHLRGHPIDDLIGNVSFAEMTWLLVRGDRPSVDQARLFEAALVSAVDHGPQAPSIAAARMAVTCGLPLNNAMASAVNMLGDVHGGAGEQAVELFHHTRAFDGTLPEALDVWTAARGKIIPGFGHRFHTPVDPRAPRLMSLVAEAVDAKACTGEFATLARGIEAELAHRKGGPIPMNIDGATAVIYAELGFAPPLARGLFCLSRSVGILAHAWEQSQQGGRNKGPTPPAYRWTYEEG